MTLEPQKALRRKVGRNVPMPKKSKSVPTTEKRGTGGVMPVGPVKKQK